MAEQQQQLPHSRTAKLVRIAQLKKEIQSEQMRTSVVREQAKQLRAAESQLAAQRAAERRLRDEEAEQRQFRATYRPRAPWEKVEADPEPWITFVHDPDERPYDLVAHDTTLRPADFSKTRHTMLVRHGHSSGPATTAASAPSATRFVDTRGQNGPLFRLIAKGTARRAKIATQHVLCDLKYHGRKREFSTSFMAREAQKVDEAAAAVGSGGRGVGEGRSSRVHRVTFFCVHSPHVTAAAQRLVFWLLVHVDD
jgi:hypothetical protein